MEHLANEHANERRTQLRVDREYLQEELTRAKQKRTLDNEARGLCNTMADAKWSDDDLAELLDMYNSFSLQDTARVKNAQMDAVPVPDQGIRDLVLQREKKEPRVQRPWWVPHIAWNRADFRWLAISNDE